MPYQDEEEPGQPLWQSVLLFCCTGVIEGIMVVLFCWLLVQVLFTRQLEVHLQILLLVGLFVFCLSLVLGCVVCWKKSQSSSVKVKPAQPAGDPLPSPQNLVAPGGTAGPLPQLEEDALEFPSTFTSPAPSESDSSDGGGPSRAAGEQAPSYFSLRRFSSPLQSAPLYKPMHPSRASLPALPRLGVFNWMSRAMQRRRTLAGDHTSYDEHSRLTGPRRSQHEDPIPLATLDYGSKMSAALRPCLHFTAAFSPGQRTLTVTVLSLTGAGHGLDDVDIRGSLQGRMAAQRSSAHEPQRRVLLWRVRSVQELQTCLLQLSLHARGPQSSTAPPIGQVELKCGETDWRAERLVGFTKELTRQTLNVEN